MSQTHQERVEERIPKPSSGRNRFAHFEDEIISKVIRPYLVQAIREGQPCNKTELLEHFRRVTGYEGCTLHTLSEWMEKCGFRIQRQMQIVADEEVEAPLPPEVKEIGDSSSGAPRPAGGAPPRVSPKHGGLARPF